MHISSSAWRMVLLLWTLAAAPLAAVEWSAFEGTARGFPVLRDGSGKKIADGDFVQWIDNDRLHVRLTYTGASRRIEERAVFKQRPELIQEWWSFEESRNGKLYRQFQLNFASGSATAKKLDEGELGQWSDKVDIVPGRTFAGFGFSLAVKGLRTRLLRGEHVELQTVGFTPKPRVIAVDIFHGGLDRMRMADRVPNGDRFIIHPKLPWFADLFVNVPDVQIWLTSPAPAAFLRFEGPLAEAGDPIARVDVLPGGSSEPATPVGTTGVSPHRQGER